MMPKTKKVKTEKKSTIQLVRLDINPQLCKTLNPAKHKWDYAWMIEPKFDGLRCWIVVENHKARAYSRNGKPLWNMKVILDEVEEAGFDKYILDGEVYTKDWNSSMSITKRSTKVHPDMDKLNFHVWDSLNFEELNTTWKNSQNIIHKVYSSVSNQDRKEHRLWPWTVLKSEHVQIVDHKWVSSNEQLQEAYLEFLVQGYEGAILKDPKGTYEGGRRSPNWLKIKPWTDADLTIIGSYPGEGKHLGRIGGLILEGKVEWNDMEYSVHTEVGTGFNDEEREAFQQMSELGTLVGKIVEIKFQDITVEGSCRFPVYHRLREDRD